MKKFLRKKLKHPRMQDFFAHLVFLYLKFVHQTSSCTTHCDAAVQKHLDSSAPTIIVFFHGRLAMMGYAWKFNRPFHMLLSDHSDGQFISKVIAHSGYQSIYGSTTRGGLKASFAMVKVLKNGGCIGVTPDGPRGPNQSVSEGLIQIARLTNAAIIPVSFSIKRHKRLKSWDKFMLPLPFSRSHFAFGDPITVPQTLTDTDVEGCKDKIRAALLQLEAACDAIVA